MRRSLLALLAIAPLAACSAPLPDQVTVSDAWVRLAGAPGRPAAGYFTLHGGRAPARLIAIESAKAGNIELHEMVMRGTFMTMGKIDGADVFAGSDLKFAPGGKHAMLFGLDPSLKPGDTIPLSFRFAKGAPVTAQTKVVATDAEGP